MACDMSVCWLRRCSMYSCSCRYEYIEQSWFSGEISTVGWTRAIRRRCDVVIVIICESEEAVVLLGEMEVLGTLRFSELRNLYGAKTA
jgi:hypothetical protein